MSNSLITCNIVAKEALAILQNMLGFAANVNTDWQDEFSGNSHAVMLQAQPSTLKSHHATRTALVVSLFPKSRLKLRSRSRFRKVAVILTSPGWRKLCS